MRMSADCVAFSASCRCVDEAQVGAADLELRLHDLERALVVGERLRQDLLALARGDLRGQRVLDFAERAQADRRIRGDRLLLLGGPDLDLRLERAALVDRARAGWRRSSTPDCRGPGARTGRSRWR